jgi:hypothetical protein
MNKIFDQQPTKKTGAILPPVFLFAGDMRILCHTSNYKQQQVCRTVSVME